MQAATERRKRPYGQVGLCGLRRSQKTSVWTGIPLWATSMRRKYPCGEVGLCGLRREQKTCVWMSKPLRAKSVRRKCPCGQVGLCRPRQRLESVCMDEKACVGYVSEKEMSIWTGWPVQAVTQGYKVSVQASKPLWGMSVKSRCPCGTVSLWLNHVLLIPGAKASIITAFYGIRWGHHVMEFNSPTSLLFSQPLKGVSGYKIVTKYGGENSAIPDLRFLLTCLLGFA